jgi:helix-turn-helix protein
VSERVVADFVGRFYLTDLDRSEPMRGRVVLSPKRLVLAGEDRTVTIPLEGVFDVAVGHVPEEMRPFFQDTVTVAYNGTEGRRIAVVEADADTIDKFSTVLFKAHLTGREVVVEHPAKRGGRVVDSPARRARLSVEQGNLAFQAGDGSFEVDLATVTDFETEQRPIDGTDRAVLSVRHVPEATALVSVIALPSDRVRNLLGRYLRLEYSDIVEALDDVALSDEELQALLAIYSAGDGVDPFDVVTVDGAQTTLVLNRLRDKGLVADRADGTALTARGRVVVNRRLEDVNE